MKNLFKVCGIFGLPLALCCCQSSQEKAIVPAIVPSTQKATIIKSSDLDIIGAVEPIYFLPMKSAFEARIDTGATTSSIDADEIVEFERDGEKWVSFKVINRRSGETHTFEKPILENLTIKRIDHEEHRIKVSMNVQFGGKKFASDFTLAKRDKFSYQALVGRSLLTGRAIVDTSLSHTLK